MGDTIFNTVYHRDRSPVETANKGDPTDNDIIQVIIQLFPYLECHKATPLVSI